MGEFPGGQAHHGRPFHFRRELYAINDPEFSWAIGQLDDYERAECRGRETAPYKREEVIDTRMAALTSGLYWFNGNVDGKPEIESGDLLQYLQQKNKP